LLRRRAANGTDSVESGPINGQEYEDLLNLIRLAQQQAFPNLFEVLEVSQWHEILAGKHGNSAKAALQPLKKEILPNS